MIQLNKPYINSSKSGKQIEPFINSLFPNRKFTLTFSARQGLSEIYRYLFINYGALNVAVSPLTCVEALYPIVQNGHKIQFVDINPDTLNMDESIIPENMDVIQAIHLGGNPQDMEIILNKKPRIIVEDCAQGFGSFYNSVHVGLFGDYSVFSFMKNLYSLGGGGLISKDNSFMIETKNKEFKYLPTLYRQIKRYLETRTSEDFGVNQIFLNAILNLKPENTSLQVTNSNINSCIRKSIIKQIGIYDEIISKRKEIGKLITSNINSNNLKKQINVEKADPNFLRLFFISHHKQAVDIIKFLRMRGIGANHLTQNSLRYYQQRFDKHDLLKSKISREELPNYFELHDRVFCIPISPVLSKREIHHIVNNVNSL